MILELTLKTLGALQCLTVQMKFEVIHVEENDS